MACKLSIYFGEPHGLVNDFMLLLVNTASSEIKSKTFQRPDILWFFGGEFIMLSLFVECSSTHRLIKILGLLCILMQWV